MLIKRYPYLVFYSLRFLTQSQNKLMMPSAFKTLKLSDKSEIQKKCFLWKLNHTSNFFFLDDLNVQQIRIYKCEFHQVLSYSKNRYCTIIIMDVLRCNYYFKNLKCVYQIENQHPLHTLTARYKLYHSETLKKQKSSEISTKLLILSMY